jgi:hypothetical protein
MSKSWPWVLALGIAWIIFVPIRIMVPLAWEQAQRVHDATSVTQGKVIAFTLANHATGTIEYWVNGVRYEAGSSGMHSSDLGTSVPIHYAPQNPSKAYVGNSPPSFTHDLFGIGFIVMIVLAVVLYAAFDGRQIWSKSTRTKPPPLPR